MTQMADKDRPYSPLRLLLPTPITVSNFQSSTRTEEVELPGGEGKEGRERGGGQERDSKVWEALAVWGRNRRALKAICRPQGAGGGGAGSGSGAADTGITNNPGRHPGWLRSQRRGRQYAFHQRSPSTLCLHFHSDLCLLTSRRGRQPAASWWRRFPLAGSC